MNQAGRLGSLAAGGGNGGGRWARRSRPGRRQGRSAPVTARPGRRQGRGLAQRRCRRAPRGRAGVAGGGALRRSQRRHNRRARGRSAACRRRQRAPVTVVGGRRRVDVLTALKDGDSQPGPGAYARAG